MQRRAVVFGFLCSFAILLPLIAQAGPNPFAQFPAVVYRGPTVMPDFKGKQRPFADLRTKLAQGFRGAAAFGGSWRVIDIGCGSGCVMIYLGDLATGTILETALGGEEHGQLDLKYRPDSRLLLATWAEDFEGTSCKGQGFVLEPDRLRAATAPMKTACPK